ncbi:methyltransferase domain-containing protein [Gordonia sp. X0973]|nr:methyltransferase domain-containing protein [Gordonia sp. X0973]
MPSFHSTPADDGQQELLVAVLDAQADLTSIKRMRAWASKALGVRPGEHVLDVGSGTGSEVLAMAAAVGSSGRAVGVDPNPRMIELADTRTGEAPATFVEGSAYALPFPDDTFDAVRCERVFQHLEHPERATAEIARVLKPGGRAILIDSDWSTAIMHPIDPTIVAAMQSIADDRTPNRESGRRLRGLLSAAGFVIDDIGSEAVIFQPEVSAPMYAAQVQAAVASGVLTQAQAEQATAELEQGLATGDYLFSVTMYAVLGHLPTAV